MPYIASMLFGEINDEFDTCWCNTQDPDRDKHAVGCQADIHQALTQTIPTCNRPHGAIVYAQPGQQMRYDTRLQTLVAHTCLCEILFISIRQTTISKIIP